MDSNYSVALSDKAAANTSSCQFELDLMNGLGQNPLGRVSAHQLVSAFLISPRTDFSGRAQQVLLRSMQADSLAYVSSVEEHRLGITTEPSVQSAISLVGLKGELRSGDCVALRTGRGYLIPTAGVPHSSTQLNPTQLNTHLWALICVGLASRRVAKVHDAKRQSTARLTRFFVAAA